MACNSPFDGNAMAKPIKSPAVSATSTVVPAFSCDPLARFFQHICAEIDAKQTSGRADPLLYQSEVEPGAAADLHDGRAAPQLQRCNGATPVRPPSEADQVIGIHRPVVEARPAAVDFVDLLRRREVAPAQGWISLAPGTRQRPCDEVPLKRSTHSTACWLFTARAIGEPARWIIARSYRRFCRSGRTGDPN